MWPFLLMTLAAARPVAEPWPAVESSAQASGPRLHLATDRRLDDITLLLRIEGGEQDRTPGGPPCAQRLARDLGARLQGDLPTATSARQRGWQIHVRSTWWAVELVAQIPASDLDPFLKRLGDELRTLSRQTSAARPTHSRPLPRRSSLLHTLKRSIWGWSRASSRGSSGSISCQPFLARWWSRPRADVLLLGPLPRAAATQLGRRLSILRPSSADESLAPLPAGLPQRVTLIDHASQVEAEVLLGQALPPLQPACATQLRAVLGTLDSLAFDSQRWIARPEAAARRPRLRCDIEDSPHALLWCAFRVPARDARRASTALIDELGRVQQRGVNLSLLQRAQQRQRGIRLRSLERPPDLAAALLKRHLQNHRSPTEDCTKTSARDLARSLLVPRSLRLVVRGPAALLRMPLAELGRVREIREPSLRTGASGS